MTTLIVSDIHLGTVSGGDLLRRPEALAALTAEIAKADRLIVLGDLLELREAPVGAALDVARPALRALGKALDGRPLTIVPGNHDHQLGGSLFERLRVSANGDRLTLETRAAPPPDGPLAAVADAIGGDVSLAYPGVWVRPDVFAIHGHYLDVHNTVPTLERLAIGVVERLIGGLPEGRLTPADYEAAVAPIYALTYTLAQASPAGRRLVGGGTSVRAWRMLASDNGRRGIGARLAGGLAVPGAIAALNRAGLGPLKPDLTAVELRRAGLRAIGTVIERLGVEADHVIFGHTHRSGPHPNDRPGWTIPSSGARLINTGSWVVEPIFLGRSPRESPYWPGTCVVVPDIGPPRLKRLLERIPPAP